MSTNNDNSSERPEFNPNPSRCSFWLIPKKRFCQFEVRKNSKFCGNHLPVEEQEKNESSNNSNNIRIPCPLNPNHTIFQHDLTKHLKVCPDKRHDSTTLPYFVKGLHSALASSSLAPATSSAVPIRTDEKFSQEHKSHRFLSKEELAKTWNVISGVFKKFVAPDLDLEGNEWIRRSLFLSSNSDDGDDKENKKWKPSYAHHQKSNILNVSHQQRSTTSKKHGVQHQALVQILIDIGAISPSTNPADVVVELGAGKAELALAIADFVCSANSSATKMPHIIVADRGGFRRKADSKVGKDSSASKNDGEESSAVASSSPAFQRLRIDVQDLDLFKVPISSDASPLLSKNASSSSSYCAAVVGKHLCGACTDFTISASLFGSSNKTDESSEDTTIKPHFIDSVNWIMIATCCHHRCERKYFEMLITKIQRENNIPSSKSLSETTTATLQNLLQCFDILKSNEIFGPLVSLTSWGTCGHARRQRQNDGDDADEHNEEILVEDEATTETTEIDNKIISVSEFLSTTTENSAVIPDSAIARERAGRMCKLILDWMRCQILKASGKFKHVELVPFLPSVRRNDDDKTDEEDALVVTKENWVILAWN